MPQPRMRRTGPARALLFALGSALGGVLGGCSAATFAELPVIGMPAGTPERPAEPPAYPAVYERPDPRSDAPLSVDDQQKLTSELEALRARQSGRARAIAPSAGRKPVQQE